MISCAAPLAEKRCTGTCCYLGCTFVDDGGSGDNLLSASSSSTAIVPTNTNPTIEIIKVIGLASPDPGSTRLDLGTDLLLDLGLSSSSTPSSTLVQVPTSTPTGDGDNVRVVEIIPSGEGLAALLDDLI